MVEKNPKIQVESIAAPLPISILVDLDFLVETCTLRPWSINLIWKEENSDTDVLYCRRVRLLFLKLVICYRLIFVNLPQTKSLPYKVNENSHIYLLL